MGCGMPPAALPAPFAWSSQALDLLLQDEPRAARSIPVALRHALSPGPCLVAVGRLPIRQVLCCVRHGWCGAVGEFAMVAVAWPGPVDQPRLRVGCLLTHATSSFVAPNIDQSTVNVLPCLQSTKFLADRVTLALPFPLAHGSGRAEHYSARISAGCAVCRMIKLFFSLGGAQPNAESTRTSGNREGGWDYKATLGRRRAPGRGQLLRARRRGPQRTGWSAGCSLHSKGRGWNK